VTGEQQEELIPLDDEMKQELAMVLKTRARQQVVADYVEELREKATIKLDGPLAAAVESAQEVQTGAAEDGSAPATVPDASTTAP